MTMTLPFTFITFRITSALFLCNNARAPSRCQYLKSLSGNASYFHNEVTSWLEESKITYHTEKSPHNIIGLGQERDFFHVGLHLVPTPTALLHNEPNLCKKLTDDTTLPFKTIIHLHQDVWNNKKDIVQSRIYAKVERVKHRWFARKTSIKRINIKTTIDFLNTHHLWGATRSKFNYGLFMNDDLVAVATFSPRRHVRRGTCNRFYRSHELIRYCSVKNGHVIGGITKLIAGFCRDFAPDDLVTCIDRDWGDGRGWESIGFQRVSVMPPLIMGVGEDGVRRYLVGAGIGSNYSSCKHDRNGRPGISIEAYKDLDEAASSIEAVECMNSHKLYPVYDSGVERRILLINKSKLDSQAKILRKELGLEDLNRSDESVLDLWANSSPSFPNKYYSKNKGINALLKGAERAEVELQI